MDNPNRQGVPEPAELDEDVVGRPVKLPDPEDLAAGIEQSDVDLRGVAKAGLALLIFIVVSVLIITGLQWAVTGRLGDFRPPQNAVAPAPEPTTIPEGITRRVNAVQSYIEARDMWRTRLDHYTYLDEEKTVVSIPITTAIDKLLSEGFFQSRPASDAFVDDGRMVPADSSGGWTMERTREWTVEATPTP